MPVSCMASEVVEGDVRGQLFQGVSPGFVNMWNLEPADAKKILAQL